MGDSDWLTVQQATAYLKVSRVTVYQYMASGRLPWSVVSPQGKTEERLKGGRRIRRSDLDRLIQQGGGGQQPSEP